MFGTACGRVPRLAQLAGQKLAQNKDPATIIKIYSSFFSVWVALGLGSDSLADYLDLMGGLLKIYYQAGSELTCILIARIYHLMTFGSRLARHFNKFKLDLAKHSTLFYSGCFFKTGMGLEFIQPRALVDSTHYYHVARASRLVKLNTGWIPDVKDFAPLPWENAIKKLTNVKFVRSDPKPPSPNDVVPDFESNLLLAWVRYNHCCFHESFLWCMAALYQSSCSQVDDILILSSNNVARLGLSPWLCSFLLKMAARRAIHSWKEWDVVLGLQVYCASFGLFKREKKFFSQTDNLPAFSTIRKKAFSVHMDSCIEWCENKLLIVMCNREYHHYCRGDKKCENSVKSFSKIWIVFQTITEMRKILNKERDLNESMRSYWMGLTYLLEGAALALERGLWKHKRARLLGEWGRVMLFNIRGRFSVHHKRNDELRVLCAALQNCNGQFIKLDEMLVSDRFDQLAHKEMIAASHRSISLLLRLTLYFQLFEEGTHVASTFSFLLKKASQDLKILPGKWYRSALVKSCCKTFVENKTCLFRPLAKGVAQVGGNKRALKALSWIKARLGQQLVKPTWSDLVILDKRVLQVMSVGHYTERLRPVSSFNHGGPLVTNDTDSDSD